MAKKSQIRPERVASERAVRLAASAANGHEIVVSWAPGRARPISIFLLRVNGARIAHDELDTDSPVVKVDHMPPPNSDGKYVVDFSIKPEVDIDTIVVSIRNRATNKSEIVDHKDNPDRVDPWTEIGVTVNAP